MTENAGLEVLTVAELADRLRIGRSAAYALCHRADFPAVRVGGVIRVPIVSFASWLALQTGDGAWQARARRPA